MDGMNDMPGMHHDMPGMGSMAPPPAMTGAGGGMNKGMMHMTFFWGKNAQILFTGWPGSDSGMYALALILIFVAGILVEWLSQLNFIRVGSNHVAAGLVHALVHLIRVGLSYLVMLAVMSFNVGVFLVAVGGHALGFLLFRSGVFKKSPEAAGKTSDFPATVC